MAAISISAVLSLAKILEPLMPIPASKNLWGVAAAAIASLRSFLLVQPLLVLAVNPSILASEAGKSLGVVDPAQTKQLVACLADSELL